MGRYRYDIGLGDRYLFGSEIEFTGVYLEHLDKLFSNMNLPVRYIINHKSNGYIKYDEWYLDKDSTVTIDKDGNNFGGELSSKILTDKKKYWEELRDICDVLKSNGAFSDFNCSNHVRVNLACIKDENYFFEVLTKLIALYEIDIKLFYMGDDYLKRSTAFEYARDLGDSLLSYINEIDFSSPDFYYKFRHNGGVGYFTCRDAINSQDYENKRLMEIRYPNGTIREKTIQNNINFTLKLIDAIRREIFDPKELSQQIEDRRDRIFINSLTGRENRDDFTYLVDRISTSSEDRDDFMSQYEHVLSKRPKL